MIAPRKFIARKMDLKVMTAVATLLQKAPAASPWDRALILAGLAFVSALLTNFAGEDPWRMLSIAFDKDVPTPILPGLYFGLVIGAAVYVWTTRNTFNFFAVLLMTIFAWIAAHHTAVLIFRYHETLAHQIQDQIAQQFSDAIARYRDLLAGFVPPDKMPELENPSFNFGYPFSFAIGGIFAGLVGSAMTALGVSMVSPDFRTVEN